MVRFWHRFRKACSGATAIEYGLIAALIAVVIITGISSLGTSVGGTMNTLAANVAAK
jgi:pilus assembly protein Flp/PilA